MICNAMITIEVNEAAYKIIVSLEQRSLRRVCAYAHTRQSLRQWRSKNAEKVTHIKGRLLYQAMILYNYVPF